MVAKFAFMKGAKRVIGIDQVPSRLKMAQERLGIEVINFSEHKDVVKRIYELEPMGLDCALDCGVSSRHGQGVPRLTDGLRRKGPSMNQSHSSTKPRSC